MSRRADGIVKKSKRGGNIFLFSVRNDSMIKIRYCYEKKTFWKNRIKDLT